MSIKKGCSLPFLDTSLTSNLQEKLISVGAFNTEHSNSEHILPYVVPMIRPKCKVPSSERYNSINLGFVTPTVRLRCWTWHHFCMQFKNQVKSMERYCGRECYLGIKLFNKAFNNYNYISVSLRGIVRHVRTFWNWNWNCLFLLSPYEINRFRF